MEFHDVLLRLAKDHIVQLIALGVLVFSACIVYFSFTLALITVLSFGVGIAGAQFLLNHREQIGGVAGRVKSVYCPEVSTSVSNTCLICDTSDCSGHDESQRDFKEFKVNSALDAAVESFYTRILSSFVQSWFSLLSHDEDFIQLLKTNLREATCRIIDRIQKLDIPAIITYKLLPNFYSHHKMIQEMIERGVPLDKLADSARHNEISIHPAVINRKAELNYLRAISKYLIPRLFKNENFDSNIFFSLIRELIACWVLLPLMDVLSDPNLINLLILLITNKDSKKSYIQTDIQDRVVFLKKFVTRSKLKRKNQIETANIDDILQDPEKLFPFMQFLKKEGAVEILRFYLDVSALNKDLQDPKVTTDPSKLSSLYQQSEKLLNAYNALVTFDNDKKPLDTLDAANEDARIALEELFGKAFQNSAAYFQLIYGSRDIKENPELKNGDLQGSTKISTKLREVIRGAVDGMPLEALETPTVWDAFTDIDGVLEKGSLFNPGGGPKMRKDRVRGLEPFVMTFFQSIEQNADLGEDVISISDHSNIRPCPPGRNLVFGDLFEMRKANTNASSINKVDVRGPSQCLLYFLKEIYRAPVIILRFAMTVISVSRSTVDTLISGGIMKLIYLGLYEPRLASLITLLEAHLFNEREPGPSAAELLERQRQAFKRLNAVKQGLGAISTTLQSPALNKHLMYSLFDIVLSELFPDLKLN